MLTTEWYNGFEKGLEDARALRSSVLPEDTGENDMDAMNLVVYENGSPIGTGRILFDGEAFIFDRLCVLPEFRNQGIGDFLLRLMIRRAFLCRKDGEYYAYSCALSRPLFERLGFEQDGSCEFDAAGITVLKMKRSGDVIRGCRD